MKHLDWSRHSDTLTKHKDNAMLIGNQITQAVVVLFHNKIRKENSSLINTTLMAFKREQMNLLQRLCLFLTMWVTGLNLTAPIGLKH